MLKFVLSLSLVLVPIAAHADNLNPPSRWCHAGKVTVVTADEINAGTTGSVPKAERTFDGATLPGAVKQYCKRAGTSTSTTTGSTTGTPIPSGGDCGIFDDYAKALHYAKDYCATSYLNGVAADDIGDVIVQILGPDRFFAADHHTAYTLNQGLQFVCIRCDAMTTPTGPGEPPPPH